MRKVITFILTMAFQYSFATNYYISSSIGNDSNNGTSISSPWKTLSKVSSATSSFLPGDSVFFKKGDIWRGQRLYSVNHSSGTLNNPIVYTSYGQGAKPILSVISNKNPTWVNQGGNKWSTPTSDYRRFFKNNIEMLRAQSLALLGLHGTEYYTSGSSLFVYSTTNPSGFTYSWANYATTIFFKNANYINLIGLDVRGSSNYSINIENNRGWNIENCNIGYNSAYGCRIKQSSQILINNCSFNSNLTVDQSLLPSGITGSSRTGCSDGVFIQTGSSYILIENSFFKNWGHASFSANSTSLSNRVHHITFRNNEVTSPDILYGGRVAYSGYAEDCELYNNYIHHIAAPNQLGGSRNHFHHNIIDGVLDSPLKSDPIGIGIWLQNYNGQIKNNIIENNLIMNTQSHGFEIYSINWDRPNEVSGNIFRNNILFNCGTEANDVGIQFHEDQAGQSIYNNHIKNNLIYNVNSTQTCLHQYNGTICDASVFNSLNSKISNNISGNPLFVNTQNNDFHLTQPSPCIDAGNSALATLDYEGNTIPSGNLSDIGIYEYQDCLGDSVFNIAVTNTDSSATVTWSGPSDATTWVYVHELGGNGPHISVSNNSYTYNNLGNNYTFTVYVQGLNNCNTPDSLVFNTFVNQPPIASNVQISGTPSPCETVSLNYNYSDPDGDAQGGYIVVWNIGSTEIQRDTILPPNSFSSPIFTIPSGYQGQQLSAIIHPIDIHGIGGSGVGTVSNTLIIGTEISSTEIVTSCGDYTWIDGNIYTTSNNTATQVFTASNGCDSIVYLDLTITNNTTYGTDIISSCNSYTWIDGLIYNSSNNTATYTLINTTGCDSIVTLNLTINPLNTAITSNGLLLSSDELNANYQWLLCGSNMSNISNETSQSYEVIQNGLYAVEISKNGCVDTSDCISVSSVDINESLFENMLIYPNPTHGVFNIHLDEIKNVEIKMFNALGEIIFHEKSINSSTFQSTIEGKKGAYLIMVKPTKNGIWKKQIIIKN